MSGSERAGLLCSAAGTVLGLTFSWRGFYPVWMSGHLGRHQLAIEVTLTALSGLWLAIVASRLVHGRPGGPTRPA